MKFKDYNKYLIAAIFLTIIILSFLIVKPFVGVITTSILLAYVFKPVYNKCTKRIKNKTFCAVVISILILLLLAIPTIFLLNSLTKEATVFYILVKQKMLRGDLALEESSKLNQFFSDPEIKYYIDDAIKKLTTKLADSISKFIFSIPKRILDLFIMLLIIFYILRDGDIIIDKIKRLIPIKQKQMEHLVNKLRGMIHALVYGYIIIALLEGILGGLIFFILNIPNPILWGCVIAFLSLLPFIGPPVIWVPASLILIMDGAASDSNILIIKGIVLLFYGLFILTPIDNVIKPKIVGRKAKVHPIVVLIGVLGGIYFLGSVGVILGPLILATLVAFIELYEQEKGSI